MSKTNIYSRVRSLWAEGGSVITEDEFPIEQVEPFFDKDFYLETNDDVRDAGIDPLEHYITNGWREGRNPGPDFDTSYYVDQHLNDLSEEVCPLLHYAMTGQKSGLPRTLAEAQKQHHDAKDRLWSGRFNELFRLTGFDTGKYNGDLFSRFILPMFSASHYRAGLNPTRPTSDLELFSRYLAFDLPLGVPPGPMFDAAHYKREARKRGLPEINHNAGPFLHWLDFGISAQISPTPLFSEAEYLAINPDLKSYPGWVFEHFLLHGMFEERSFLRIFHLARCRTQSLRKKTDTRSVEIIGKLSGRPGVGEEIDRWRGFLDSALMEDIVQSASKIDPEVGSIPSIRFSSVAPWQDGEYADFSAVLSLIPKCEIDTIIVMPFCKLGGSDFVASVLAHSAGDPSRILILRTEQSDWSQEHWFPKGIHTVDLSRHLKLLDPPLRQRVLYEVLRVVGVKQVFNVNSRLAFDVFVKYGERLNQFTDLYAYYFCADKTPDGNDAGYPVWYFANLIPILKAALIDTRDLAETLTQRYALPPELARKVHVVYTPAMSEMPAVPIAARQIESQPNRTRPCLIWAGRFDRQKRFDLLVEIAEAMPEVDFLCWGKAVLDKAPDLSALPANLTVNPPFQSYDELPLRNSDGWLYTSAWDGLPTILIEIGAMGVPIVASGVGGVPELIDETTGWCLPGNAAVTDYVDAIKSMLADPVARLSRATALQQRIRDNHSRETYRSHILSLSGMDDAND